MPLLKRSLVVLGMLVLIFFTGSKIVAQEVAQRFQGKAAEVQKGVRAWAAEGRDPSFIYAVMQQVKPALDAGDPLPVSSKLPPFLSMKRNYFSTRELARHS